MSSTRSSSDKPHTTVAPFSFNHDDTVTLQVSPDEHVLLAHASFIARKSDFFKAALKKEWTEGQTRVIKLPEELPHVVSYYLKYTYSRTLPADMFNFDFTLEPDEHYELLAKLYVLGERLQDDSIHTAVIKEIVRLSNKFHPIQEAANIIYRGTTAISPARRLLVDIYVAYGLTHWLDVTCEPGFLLDVAQAFCFMAESYNNPKFYRERALRAANYEV